MKASRLCPIKEYIRSCRATIALYIVNRPIYELFTEAEVMAGSIRFMPWCYQDLM